MTRCGVCLFIPVRISSCPSVMTRCCTCGTRSLVVLSGPNSCRSVHSAFVFLGTNTNTKPICNVPISPSKKLHLKLFTQVAARQLKDKSFQIFGALTENALSALYIYVSVCLRLSCLLLSIASHIINCCVPLGLVLIKNDSRVVQKTGSWPLQVKTALLYSCPCN